MIGERSQGTAPDERPPLLPSTYGYSVPFADHYDRKYGDAATSIVLAPQRSPKDRYAACVSQLPRLLPPKATVLEIGAGDGRVARSLLVHADVSRVVMTDLSPVRAAALAANLDDPRAEVLVLDADGEDWPDETFDAVVMIALIEHVLDPIAVLGRVHQRLRPGGVVWVDTPNIAKWTRRLKLAVGRFPATASRNEGLTTYEGADTELYDEGHLHYFTFRSMEMVLQRAGFASVERYPYAAGRLAPFASVRATVLSDVCVLARA